MPLELLCLRAAVSRLSLTRRPVKGIQDVFEQAKIVGKGSSIKGNQMYDRWRSYQEELSQAGGQHKNLHNLFRRHVKPKKQHEIARMASLCSAVCLASGVKSVVDVGSGVGHLSRQVFNVKVYIFCNRRASYFFLCNKIKYFQTSGIRSWLKSDIRRCSIELHCDSGTV